MNVVPLAHRLAELRPHAEAPVKIAEAPAHKPNTEQLLKHAVEEALVRGRAEALEAHRRELDGAIAAERTRSEEQLQGERKRWIGEQAEVLEQRLKEAMSGLEASLADAVAGVLKPILADALRERALGDLGGVLRELVHKEGLRSMRISGPQDLVDALGERLAGLCRLEFHPHGGVDLHVEADRTLIETRLGAWAERLKGLR